MTKHFFILIALIVFSYSYAQEGSTSPYSYYGIGDLKSRGIIENQSMGGISMYTDSIHISLKNPASYASLQLTTYAAGATYNSVRFSSLETEESTTAVSLDYLAVGIPLGNRFGMGFGLQPYSSVGYNLETFSTQENNKATNVFTGNGGTNSVYLSLGYKITDAFSVGITGDYKFGKIENNVLQTIEKVQLGTLEENESQVRGFDFNFALNYKSQLTDRLFMISTVTFSPEAKLKSDNTRTIATTQTLSDVTIKRTEQEVNLNVLGLDKTEITLPINTSFGLGFGEERKWFIGAEYTYKETKKFNNPFVTVSNIAYKNGYGFSAGGFFIPKYNSFNSYFSRVTYRVGMRIDNTGLEISGEPINDFGISFGVGLPVTGFSNANLGFEFGRRGTTEKNLIKEDYFKVKLSLSLNDRWFVKRKYD